MKTMGRIGGCGSCVSEREAEGTITLLALVASEFGLWMAHYMVGA